SLRAQAGKLRTDNLNGIIATRVGVRKGLQLVGVHQGSGVRGWRPVIRRCTVGPRLMAGLQPPRSGGRGKRPKISVRWGTRIGQFSWHTSRMDCQSVLPTITRETTA